MAAQDYARVLQDREHKLQLASMDAAYLKREVASLEARLQAVQQERDSVHAAAAAAKAHHTDMCSSLLQVRLPPTTAVGRSASSCSNAALPTAGRRGAARQPEIQASS